MEDDNTGTGTPPATGEGAPTEGTPPAGDTGQAGQSGGGDSAEVERLRRQLAANETKLTAMQKAEAKRKEAEMSELDREKSKRAELETALESERKKSADFLTRSAFQLAATKAGAINPDHLFKIADLSGVSVDDAGNVTGIDAVIKALKKDEYLFGSTKPAARTSGGNPTAGPPGAALTAEQILTMPSDEYRKRIEAFRSQHY